MSEKMCIDPSLRIAPQNLSCEPNEATSEPRQSREAQFFSFTTIRGQLPAEENRRVLNLADYTDTIARGAAQGSTPRVASLTHSNPLAFSALAMLPVACSGNGGMGDGGTTDSGTGGDTGVGGDTGTGGDGGTETVQSFGSPNLHDTAPCNTFGFITDLSSDHGVCGDFVPSPHHLFDWDPASAGALSSLTTLDTEPFRSVRSSGSNFFISNIGDPLMMPAIPAGLSQVDPSMGFQTQYPIPSVDLPAPGTTSNGDPITSFQPTRARGLTEVGDRIFVATQNLVPNSGNPSQNYYNPGTVAVFDKTSETWTDFIPTTDFNPNSIAVANGNLYVVNAGDHNEFRSPIVASPSSIDVINPDTLEVTQNIPLGNVGAGFYGEVAVSEDGNTMVIGSADNSGRIFVVDLQTSAVREISVAPGPQVALYGISMDPTGHYAYVGNAVDGNVYLVDLNTDLVVDSASVDPDTTDFLGIFDVLQEGLSVYAAVGNEIYRVPLLEE